MFLAEKLSTIGGIKNTHTYVVMEEIKASNAINVSQ
jgi:DNA-binding Lrp family transcriptional regulator